MVQHNADDGMIVVMEVATGEVKAITNLSADGNGNFAEKLNFAARNFEPGSTFKLVTMMALLEETSIELTDSIDTGNGEYRFYNNIVRDHEEGGLGNPRAVTRRYSRQRASESPARLRTRRRT